MTRFDVKILGCGSALPTTLHNPSSQLIDAGGKLFMIDCGEGTQLQMRKFKAPMSKLHSIFISHLHGDHVFGLPGLISTLNLLGRTGELNIYAFKEIECLLRPTLDFFCNHISFNVNLIPLQTDGLHEVFDSKSMRVASFPLKHRIATCGFLLEEKESPRHIIRESIDFYHIPLKLISEIKDGADFITEEGVVIENSRLTTPGKPPRRYAYCSDTAYNPKIVPYIAGADVLYHEATFAQSEVLRAHQTYHSTAGEAARIAYEAGVGKLVIGHFSSRYTGLDELLKEARAIFPNTELAYEGKSIEI